MAQASNIIPFPGAGVSQKAAASALRKGSTISRSSEDKIFYLISSHRDAVARGSIRDAQLFLRGMLIFGAKSRKGWTALAKYLAELMEPPFTDSLNLATSIDGQPWIQVFMKTLAHNLRRMGSEFPADKRSRVRPN